MMSISACMVVTGFVVLTVPSLSFAQAADAKVAQVTSAAVNKLREGDSFIAIQWVAGHDAQIAVDVFGRLQQHVYWKQKATRHGPEGLLRAKMNQWSACGQ